jgi:nitroreductase
MDVREAIESRRSVKSYDAAHEISDAELIDLFEQTVRSPSSFNLQHWRFVVVRSAKRRAELCKLAWGQRQVEQASAVIIVLGHLKAHRDAGEIYAEAPEPVREQMVPLISGIYQGKPDLQRDEAIRSGSLASMTLMLAAEAMGHATCPMIGFDPEGVCDFLSIDEAHIPIMMICLGKKAGTEPRQTSRHPIGRIVWLERMDGPALGEG